MEKLTPALIWGQDLKSAFIIDTEEKANKVLAELQNGTFDLPDNIALGDWSRLNIHLKDIDNSKWNSTITPSMFPFFYSLQKTVNKAYAKTKYGDKKYRLSKKERESIEIIIHVSEGSSNFLTELPWKEILDFMSGMSGTQKLVVILSLILAVSSYCMYSAHLDAQVKIQLNTSKNEQVLENLKTMRFLAEESREDVERVKQNIQNDDILKDIHEDIEALNREKTNVMAKADIASVSGVSVPKEISKHLSKTVETQKEGRKIDGIFKILAMYWDSTPPRIRLEQADNKIILDVEFDPLLLRGDAVIIKDAEWNNEEKFIFCRINAYVNSKEKIEKAFLVEVQEHKGDKIF